MDNLKYGLLIKLNRKNQKLSVRSLAKQSGVDFSYLAKIERGQIIAHETVINSILRELKISEEEIFRYDQKVEESFHLIYRSIVYQVNDTMPLIEELIRMEERLRKSLRYIDFVLIIYIYQIANEMTDSKQEEIEGFLSDNLQFLSSTQQAMFYDSLALRCLRDANISDAIAYIEKARLLNSDESLQPMIDYHKGMFLANQGEFFEALESYRKAKILFDEDMNMIRSFYCQMAMANSYSLLGKNEKAIDMAKHMLVMAEQLVLKSEDKALLLSNLTWFYIVDSDYFMAIQYNELATQNQIGLVNYFYFVWSYYCLVNKEQCLAWIEKSKSFMDKAEHNCVELQMIFMIETWLYEDYREEELFVLLNQARAENSRRMVNLILNMVIDFYMREKQIEKLNQSYVEYMEFLSIPTRR